MFWIDYFTERGHKFSHNNEMIIETINDKKNMNCKYYFNQPMELIELNKNVIVSKNPHLINSLDRSINQPLIRKYSNKPFNK